MFKKNLKRYEWEEQKGTSTDVTGETEEGIKEDSELEGPWTICGPMVLAEEFYQLT